ncbi:penicillin-insensitive murein endopeptidase [Nannocystis exedens]|uniref:penicillin-insensitive murein endopeptidase n=1 Tax=Nannocystis exedens TaxID=54 RepID=UPI0011608536|nr:penicillin-insensitive murein endopeptidase [Nannocystis exedens]
MPRRFALLPACLGLLLGCGDATAEPEVAAEAAPAVEVAPALAASPTPATCDGCSNGQVPEDSIAETELPLTLLATTTAADPAASQATIRDDPSGVIRVFRVGDLVWEGATIAAVERGAVILARAGQQERLVMGTGPVELRATDVYYPDLFADEDFAGVLAQGVKLPPGPGYVVKNEDHAWGTPRTVRLLQEAIRAYARGGRGGPKVHVGDISLHGGGVFPPHLSHRHGRDVDVGYVLQGTDADVTRFITATKDNLDVARSWALIEAMLATDQVHYVFMDYGLQKLFYEHAVAAGVSARRLNDVFQYPRGEGAPFGIIRHWRGHRNHFHVRFRE